MVLLHVRAPRLLRGLRGRLRRLRHLALEGRGLLGPHLGRELLQDQLMSDVLAGSPKVRDDALPGKPTPLPVRGEVTLCEAEEHLLRVPRLEQLCLLEATQEPARHVGGSWKLQVGLGNLPTWPEARVVHPHADADLRAAAPDNLGRLVREGGEGEAVAEGEGGLEAVRSVGREEALGVLGPVAARGALGRQRVRDVGRRGGEHHRQPARRLGVPEEHGSPRAARLLACQEEVSDCRHVVPPGR
mmetsp:Transcript_142077/g.345152  ORF Transcript_142077/g.345152 Transcript_142077/m.345152 type:complete len:244 (-) Transcript_142077:1621-2352(-)